MSRPSRPPGDSARCRCLVRDSVVRRGTIGNGVEALYAARRLRVLAFDIYGSPFVQFIADAHRCTRGRSTSPLTRSAVTDTSLEASRRSAQVRSPARGPNSAGVSATSCVHQCAQSWQASSRGSVLSAALSRPLGSDSRCDGQRVCVRLPGHARVPRPYSRRDHRVRLRRPRPGKSRRAFRFTALEAAMSTACLRCASQAL
jgi:hypothetical protein